MIPKKDTVLLKRCIDLAKNAVKGSNVGEYGARLPGNCQRFRTPRLLKRQRSKFRRVLKRCLPRCLQWKEQKPFPRWLHVLRPAEHSRDGQEEREEVTLDSIREQMEQLTSTMNEKVETLSKKMDNSLAMAKATSEVLTFGAQKPTRNL